MHFVILHPFDLVKFPKDAEFNEVLHELCFNEVLHENTFMFVSWVIKGPESEFQGFRSFGMTERPEFTEYGIFSGKNPEKEFFIFFFFKYFFP